MPYKATYNYKCRDQVYEIGKEYKINEKPVICEKGFHYCINAQNVLPYYPISPDFKLLEIEDLSEDTVHHDDKSCSNHIKIIREITDKDELFSLLKIFYNYDPTTRMLRIDNPTREYWEETTYDEHKNVLNYKNSKGRWNKYTYNEYGKESKLEDYFGNLRECTYHPNGNMATFKNKSFQFTEERTYNEAGSITYEKNSKGLWKEWTYNKDNKMLTYKDYLGKFDEYTYDEKGQEILYLSYQNNVIECNRTIEYDEKGNVIDIIFKAK